jgi:hypothetical protein
MQYNKLVCVSLPATFAPVLGSKPGAYQGVDSYGTLLWVLHSYPYRNIRLEVTGSAAHSSLQQCNSCYNHGTIL